jgi:hypothetical protein
MIRQIAVQNNMRNICDHRENEGTITGRAVSTLQGVDVSCKTTGDAAGDGVSIELIDFVNPLKFMGYIEGAQLH